MAVIYTLAISACEQEYSQGQAIYEDQCANCHQPSGVGLIGNIPPLAGADWMRTNSESIPCVIRYGMKGKLVVNGLNYNAIMGGHPKLTDAEITNVSNYILKAWGNELPPLAPARVTELLKACSDRELLEANPQQLLEY